MDSDERLKRQKEFLIGVAYWTVWVIFAILLIKYVGPVLIPFIIAFAVAWLLYRPATYISEKIHIKQNLVSVVLVIAFYALVGILIYVLFSRLVGLVQGVFEELTAFLSETIFPMLERFFSWTDNMARKAMGAGGENTIHIESEELVSRAGELVSGVSGTVISKASGFAAGIPGFVMKILIAVIATVFMEIEFTGIMKFLKRQVPDRWQRALQEGKTFLVGTIGKFVLSYAIILGITFVELTVGFLILGIEGAVVVAFLIAILDILPVLGTGTILIPWMIIAFATGNIKMGVGILLLYLVITVVRNILEPKLVGRQMGLSPVIMLPSMLIGLQLFGIIGLFLVPFGVAFLKNLNDRGVIHIFRTQVDEDEGK